MHQFLRASIGLLAVAVMGSTARAEPQVAPPGHAAVQVISFDNWEVRRGRIGDSYLLIGRSREQDGQFWLNCDSNGLINIAVPLGEENKRDRLRSFPVTIWSDGRSRHELNLLVFQGFVAVALDHAGGNDKLATFLDVLQAAKQTFAISYDGHIFEFDVAKLPVAQARFMMLCKHRPVTVAAAAQ